MEATKAELAKLVVTGPQQSEPVAPVNVQNNITPVTEVVPNINKAQAQELAILKEDLAAQEALRARERDLKKAAEEEQRETTRSLRRAEESLRKGHQACDRIEEEKENLLQEQDKLQKSAEVEINRLKEELGQ